MEVTLMKKQIVEVNARRRGDSKGTTTTRDTQKGTSTETKTKSTESTGTAPRASF
jgi:hypothetical protein